MKTFRPIATIDSEFPLAATTIGTKRRLNELQVRALIIPKADRLALCKTMGWDAERVVDELTEPAYYAAAAEVLFPGAPIAEHADDLDQGVVAEAANFFRASSYGQR